LRTSQHRLPPLVPSLFVFPGLKQRKVGVEGLEVCDARVIPGWILHPPAARVATLRQINTPDGEKGTYFTSEVPPRRTVAIGLMELASSGEPGDL
jgi:hypothetical protein